MSIFINLNINKYLRYQAALKNSYSGSSNTNKVDAVKEELEDIELKVEQCRVNINIFHIMYVIIFINTQIIFSLQDSLASEIFQLISREAELSSVLMELIKHQRSYHQTALAVLDEIVPELETVIGM